MSDTQCKTIIPIGEDTRRAQFSVQYLLELQRDWGRSATYDLTTGIAKLHGGGYGLGIQYAKSMFGASEGGH